MIAVTIFSKETKTLKWHPTDGAPSWLVSLAIVQAIVHNKYLILLQVLNTATKNLAVRA